MKMRPGRVMEMFEDGLRSRLKPGFWLVIAHCNHQLKLVADREPAEARLIRA
jgi:hypothetical protein